MTTNLTDGIRTHNADDGRSSIEASGAGIDLALEQRVADVTISGVECVEALCAAGFRVRRRAAGQTVLERGPRTLVVPDHLVLPPAVLEAILSEADLSIERFVWLLGEVTTETEIGVLPP